MKSIQISAIIKRYREKILEYADAHPISSGPFVDLCKTWFEQAESFANSGAITPAVMKLGFIQGILYEKRIYTLEEIASHTA